MDHTKLSKFPTRTDPLFIKIIEVIRTLLVSGQPRTTRLSEPQSFQDVAASLESLSQFSSESLLELQAEWTLKGLIIPLGISTPTAEFVQENLTILQEAPGAKLPCRVVKPHQPNPNFVGRQDVREKLHQTLAPRLEIGGMQQSYALCGLGGVGKTQTALSYVFEYMNDFQALLWAPADSRAKLLESFTNFAFELGLMKDGDSNRTGRDLLKKWFEQASMLVFSCSNNSS